MTPCNHTVRLECLVASVRAFDALNINIK